MQTTPSSAAVLPRTGGGAAAAGIQGDPQPMSEALSVPVRLEARRQPIPVRSTPVADRLRQRLEATGRRFHANDNIAE